MSVQQSSPLHPSITDEMDDAAVARVRANLTLTQRFVAAVFADPSIVDGIPDGASLVLFDAEMPEDEDREQAAAAMERAGQVVHRARM